MISHIVGNADPRTSTVTNIAQWFRDAAAAQPEGTRFAPSTLLAMAETIELHAESHNTRR